MEKTNTSRKVNHSERSHSSRNVSTQAQAKTSHSKLLGAVSFILGILLLLSPLWLYDISPSILKFSLFGLLFIFAGLIIFNYEELKQKDN